MIANSGHDERGKYSGGAAGDQTGTEWAVIPWYNRPWTCILRHPDKTVRELIAQLGEEAAHNDLIGYDQAERWSFWKQLQAAGYRPSKITTPCEADCSAGVISIVWAVGELLSVHNLKHLSATYTGNMRAGFRAAGFQVLTASKYLASDKYLRRGDILLNDAHHTAINLTNGRAATNGVASTGESMLRRGDKGAAVTAMQKRLISAGYNVGSYGADGDFGPATEQAVKQFQAANDLIVDGIVGPDTRAALAKYDVEAIAREVIAGKWGCGSDRKKRLEAAGHSYATVQAVVNRLLRS